MAEPEPSVGGGPFLSNSRSRLRASRYLRLLAARCNSVLVACVGIVRVTWVLSSALGDSIHWTEALGL